MKRKTFLLLLFIFYYFESPAQYVATYKVSFILDTISMKKKTELTSLYITENQTSYFFSQNFLKIDSLRNLVIEGKIPPSTVSKVPYPSTQFNLFIEKQYSTQNLKVFHKIHRFNYLYSTNKLLNWHIQSDTTRIKGYTCSKAITKYEGRNYTAWYTTEIPISDGPYKFWGLPGLIVEISDDEKHYTFTLDSFEKETKKQQKNPFSNTKTFEVSYEKFRAIHKSFIENPLKILEEQGSKVVSINGQDPSLTSVKKKQNPIERY